MVSLLYLKGGEEIWLLKGMRFILNHQLLRRINLKIQKVSMHRIPHLKGIVGVIFHKLGLIPLLEEGGGILQLDRKIMKVLGYEGVNVKEFFVDIFKSKKKFSFALHWK